MRVHSTIAAVGVAVALGGCAGAAKQQATNSVAGTQCAALSDTDRQVSELYASGNVQQVKPIYRTEFVARAIQPRYVTGAELYVPAQPNMNQAYLERVLSCHAASNSAAHPNDPLRVANIKDIDVEAVGQRFRVAITGADRSAGKAIWERARALANEGTQVQVEQLSAAPRVTAAF